MIQTFFPLTVDNTMYAEFKKCPVSYFRKYNQHIQGEESIDLVAGKSFAAGLEATRKSFWNDGVPENEAIEVGFAAAENEYPPDCQEKWSGEVKSLNTIIGALDSYWMEYPLSSDYAKPARLLDGTNAIEYSFAIELPIKHPELDMNLIFVGRADMLAEYAGKLWLVDEKTTSQITKHFSASWETRSQFSGYCWGLQQEGIPVSNILVRGIGLYKTSFKHIESHTGRSQFELEVWKNNFFAAVQQMVDFYIASKEAMKADKNFHASKIWPSSLAEGCMSYMRPCKFIDSCKSHKGEKILEADLWDENSQQIWLPHEQRRAPLKEFLCENFPELINE